MITSYEDISKRAYEIWEEQGKPVGKDMEHWLQAEQELRQNNFKEQQTQKVTSKDPALLKPAKNKLAKSK
jgi:hypothetical protein